MTDTKPASPAPLNPFAEPRKAVTGGWIAAFATAWFGIWMAQLTPVHLLLPVQIEAQLGATYWVDNVVAFGIISGIAGLCALIAYPLTGALSDRTTSRFGRRRPWIAAGALLFAASLFVLGLQESIVGVGVFWALALTGFCVLTAALTASISDQVPVNQRGYVSGWISAPQAIGTILGGHGITAWGDTSEEAEGNSLWIIDTAQAYIDAHGAAEPFGGVRAGFAALPEAERRAKAAALAATIRGLASTDKPMVGHFTDSDVVLDFLASEKAPALAALSVGKLAEPLPNRWMPFQRGSAGTTPTLAAAGAGRRWTVPRASGHPPHTRRAPAGTRPGCAGRARR